MLKRFQSSTFASAEKKVAEEPEESALEVDETSGEEGEEEEEHDLEAYLIPSDHEKKAILASFDAMRRESLFCDVAFICQGVLFRCHRVVVSSWSRWMRTFLCDSPEEEVLSLEIFTPDAFRRILDNMYGQPLRVTVETSDSLLKVVRRLEMHKLEQQIWRYLITILDGERNCEYLYELADRYDCPPLKLAAWRILKEKIPDISAFPTKAKLLRSMNDKLSEMKGTGLISPGDPLFNCLALAHPTHGVASNRRPVEENVLPSVFDAPNEDDDGGEEDDEREDRSRIPRVEDLDSSAPATMVVMAWAKRLKEVYQSCAPIDAFDTVQIEELRITDNTPNVRLNKVSRSANQARDRSDMLGGNSDTATNRSPSRPSDQRAASANRNHRPGNTSSSPIKFKIVKGVRTVDWSAELVEFYQAIGEAQKIAGIPAILKAWAGKEEEMLSNLVNKYKGRIPRHVLQHIDQITSHIETQTEASSAAVVVPRGKPSARTKNV